MHKHNPIDTQLSLGQAANQFLTTIPSDSSQNVQQEVFKFVRWYGENKKISSLTGQEVSHYSDQLASSSSHSSIHLTTIKQFLAFAYKQGLSPINLSTHIKIRKVASRNSVQSIAKSDEPILLTKQGLAELEKKLSALKDERPIIADELRKAAADKDFRENAPLEAAREKQGHIEGQIRELEETIRKAKVVVTVSDGVLKVTLGDIVTISYVGTDEKTSYTLVNAKEANIQQGKISIASPMGQSLFNRETGDMFEVNAPTGILKYKILDIKRT